MRTGRHPAFPTPRNNINKHLYTNIRSSTLCYIISQTFVLANMCYIVL